MLYVNPAATSRAFQANPEQFARIQRKEALEEFERLFVYQLLREMRKSVPQDGLFPKSRSREVFDDMFNDALAGAVAQSGQMGIARMLEAQMEASEPAAPPEPDADAPPAAQV